MELDISLGNISKNLNVKINGNANNSIDLRVEAVKHILNSFDLKNDFNGEHEKLNQVIEEIILAAVDVIGFEHFYWEHLPKEDKYYNEDDELIVSRSGKLQLLELILKEMMDQ